MKKIALVSREVHPFSGGGIAPIVAAAARLLTALGEVTVFTTALHAERHRVQLASEDPSLHPYVRFVFVEEPEPGEHGPWFSHMHAYSARVFDALCREYPDGGPDLVEFCDYLAEGFVTTQARHTFDPRLRNTLVAVRLHTTAELCNVLDGHLRDDFATVATLDAERYVLRHADRVLWSGGDVLGTYERYYGPGALAPAERIPDAFLSEVGHPTPSTEEPPPDPPLRFLYLGRMERRKGVQNLVRAMLALDGSHDWRLTLLGGDTSTAPLQQSLKSQLELMAAGDERIEFPSVVDRAQVGAFIRAHDVVVVPSLWECWPNVVREALQQNRPVLATPVGGMVEMVRPGLSGWLTDGTSAEELTQAFERILAEPDEAHRLAAKGGPRRVFEELSDPDRLVRGYEALLASPSRRARPAIRSAEPLVSVVVPYFRLEAFVEAALESVRAQSYPNLEIVLVNDGSLRAQDEQLLDVAARYGARLFFQVNSGLGQARNFGVAHSRGRYVMPLDADDVIAPELISRCVDVLESDRSLAYVTPWSRFMSPDGELLDEAGGYLPYGNWSRLIERNNVGGTCTALLRRRLFKDFAYSPDLTSYEDWYLYRQLHAAGHHGAVIPERLFFYRVRDDSMMREVALPRVELLMDEMRAHLLEAGTRWTA